MRLIILLAMLLATLRLPAAEEGERPWRYVDALDLRVIGKGWDNTLRPYTRIPATLADSVRPTLWERAQCSAGIGVRFATNSSRIGIRYQLLWDTHLIHMADTGLKGTDLYIFEGDSTWRHVNTNRPYLKDKDNKIVESTYVENVDTTQMAEYMVYLPLYDGVNTVEIKVDSNAVVTCGRPDLIESRKIVAYGTSILQGGCASRTGMAPTNILSRELNCEAVNIGISGEGKMDMCMARAMADIDDVCLYIIDPVPNCTKDMCDTLTYPFIKTLRTLRPEVPVVMVEGPIYPYARYDSFFGQYLPAKNEAFYRGYMRIKEEDPDAPVYYIDSVDLDGAEDDGTVDGIHLTDLGFRHYADKILPILKKIL